MIHAGWHQAAYRRDLREGLNELLLDDRPLALVVAGERIEAIDARCPHRGANLCRGGRLEGRRVICPFHGYSVSLSDEGRFRARRCDCLATSGLVFVKLPDGKDCGFRARLERLDRAAYILPGFEMAAPAPAPLVIENAFDEAHFQPVHKILNVPRLRSSIDTQGALTAEGAFLLPRSRWQDTPSQSAVLVPYTATAYSPTIVISDLGGSRPYSIITASQPLAQDRCIVRLSLVVGREAEVSADDLNYLLQQARAGLEQDSIVWRDMRWPENFDALESDEPVVAFRNFAAGFDMRS